MSPTVASLSLVLTFSMWLAGVGLTGLGFLISQDQTVDSGAVTATATSAGTVVGPAGGQDQPEQTIQTTIPDPRYPDEPWVVVTYRKPGESPGAFIKRHRDMVDAIRKALK